MAVPGAWGQQAKVTRGKDSKGNPGTWHEYPGGRRVFIADAAPAGHATAAQLGAPSLGPPPPQHTPVAPFNTPDEMLGLADRQAALSTQLYDIDSGLNSMRLNNDYEKAGVDRDLKVGSSNAVDAMIARGLGQSSVKDGELNDLSASASRRKTYLDTTLNTATLEAGRKKSVLTDNFNAFKNFLAQQAVINAQNVPVAAPPAAGPAPAAAAARAQGETRVAPSAAHGGAKWVYVKNANGTWRPLRPANAFGF